MATERVRIWAALRVSNELGLELGLFVDQPKPDVRRQVLDGAVLTRYPCAYHDHPRGATTRTSRAPAAGSLAVLDRLLTGQTPATAVTFRGGHAL